MSFEVYVKVGEQDWTFTQKSRYVTVTDGSTTNGHFTVMSATANFTPLDYGSPITGAGIPAGAYIDEVTQSDTVQISDAATATATGVTLTIERPTTALDGLTVLSGLDFGWLMPSGIWPKQPDPMQASLSLNAPHFDDFNDGNPGDPVVIEVKADTAGPVIARFYGDVTDYKATARPGRPGVTISVIAVDPTIRNAEAEDIPFPDNSFPGFTERQAVAEVLPIDPGTDFDDLWSTPDRPIGNATMGERANVLAFVKAMLAQAVDIAAQTRMIISPVLQSPVEDVFDIFTIDTISADVLDFGTTVFSAAAVRRDVKWSNVKGQTPGVVVVDCNGGSGFTGRLTAEMAESSILNFTHEQLPVMLFTESEAQDVADFYAAHGFDPWQLDEFTLAVSRAGIGSDIPTTLFPDWTADELDPARAACYSRLITITDVDDSMTPDGEDSIHGILTGARCHVAGGELELTLTIRRPAAAA